MHDPVQHWFPVVHVVPGTPQTVLGASHLPVVALQFAVQHSVLFVQAAAVAVHAAASARPPSIVSMKPSVPLSAGGVTPVSGSTTEVLVPAVRSVDDRVILASASDEDDVRHGGGREQTKCSPGKLPHNPDPPCVRASAAK